MGIQHNHPRRRLGARTIAAATGLGLVALTACTTAAVDVGDGDASPATTASAAPAEPEPTPTPEPKPITLAFGGDVHFEGNVAGLLNYPQSALAPIAPHLSKADLAMVNLETAVTTQGVPEPKNYTFRTSPTALKVLQNAGVDVVTMANNHAADFGAVGLQDTLAAKEDSDIPIVGIGANAAEAFAPAEFEIKGNKVAVLGATDFYDRTATVWAAGRGKPGVASALDPERLIRAVARTAPDNDVTVVYLHWGIETHTCPSVDQQTLSDQLIQAGADVVVGSHAHRLQGSGFKDGAFVAYGLGNFVWYTTSATTGVLTVRIKDGEPVKQEFVPAFISGTGVPTPMTGDTRTNYQQNYFNLQGCSDLSAAPQPAPTPTEPTPTDPTPTGDVSAPSTTTG